MGKGEDSEGEERGNSALVVGGQTPSAPGVRVGT